MTASHTHIWPPYGVTCTTFTLFSSFLIALSFTAPQFIVQSRLQREARKSIQANLKRAAIMATFASFAASAHILGSHLKAGLVAASQQRTRQHTATKQNII